MEERLSLPSQKESSAEADGKVLSMWQAHTSQPEVSLATLRVAGCQPGSTLGLSSGRAVVAAPDGTVFGRWRRSLWTGISVKLEGLLCFRQTAVPGPGELTARQDFNSGFSVLLQRQGWGRQLCGMRDGVRSPRGLLCRELLVRFL